MIVKKGDQNVMMIYNFDRYIYADTCLETLSLLCAIGILMVRNSCVWGSNFQPLIFFCCRVCLDCNKIFLIEKQTFNGLLKVIGIQKPFGS